MTLYVAKLSRDKLNYAQWLMCVPFTVVLSNVRSMCAPMCALMCTPITAVLFKYNTSFGRFFYYTI